MSNRGETKVYRYASYKEIAETEDEVIGFVATVWGIVGVRVYCYETELSFIKDEELYCRTFQKEYSSRYLPTLARKFISEYY